MTASADSRAHTVSLRRRILSVPTLLSFGVAAAFIFFLTTRFDVDWGATLENIRGINPWLYVSAIAVYYVSFGFRGLRWRILARNANARSSPAARIPSTFQFSQLIVLGWFVNAIAGLRLGDAYRAYALSEESGGSFPWSLGTVVAERVLDMAIVLALLTVSVLFLTTTRDSSTWTYILIVSAMAFVGITLILAMKGLGIRLARLLPHRVEAAYRRFHEGTLGSFKQLPALVALGFMGWAMEIGRLFLVIHALDLSVSLALVPVVALVGAILSTVPTPGGVGAVEPGVTGLLLLELERHDAVSIAVVDRSVTYLSVLAIGLLVFSLRHLTRTRARRAQRPPARVASDDVRAVDA